MIRERPFYTARIHTTGGRYGTSRSDDGRLAITLAPPGGPGLGTNPEQLFAAGWSACFLSAIKSVATGMRVTLPAAVAVDAEIDDLGAARGSYAFGARLNVSLPGVDPRTAQTLVDAAHQVCPYSQATRGNVDVAIKVIERQLPEKGVSDDAQGPGRSPHPRHDVAAGDAVRSW